ncbi:MAG: MoxR family ATPase [Planctomycetota bacterium]|nr:MoxR family ATPase [Planctomycetota bacterium]MDA1140019.1 MoxR family ATPase [Planctomycetota bacterium]
MDDLSVKQTEEAVKNLHDAHQTILTEIRKVIVGQEEVVNNVLTALFARGHILLIGVPGLAKTLLVSTIAKVLDLKFKRIQFTPDLMPSDITGTDIIEEDVETGRRTFKFVEGPIFCNMLLADEINRTPPKTQASLLEAMQEKQVTAGNTTYTLDAPFIVLATQNPVEQEGTYNLPEAQLDRFMFNTYVDYPKNDEEVQIVAETTGRSQPEPDTVMSGEDILKYQDLVRDVPAATDIIQYAVNLVASTRPDDSRAPDFVKNWVQWGAGPRASQYLIIGGKARAILEGRFYVTVEDVQAMAKPVLRHRIFTNFTAEAEGIKPIDVINRLIETVER